MNQYLEFAKTLCQDCGQIIKEGFYKDKSIQSKSAVDFVSEYDLLVEKLVHDRISLAYPGHRFIGEETVASGGQCVLTSDPTWIVDPIDGTTNFIARFPFCCISLALYIDRECAVAVVLNPVLDTLYSAAHGEGAFLNGTRISVCPPKDLISSLVITDWGSDRNESNVLIKADNKRRLLESCRGLRAIGSAALSMCMIAQGQADVYMEQGINCWDMAGGCLIVAEAGGVLANPDGSPFDVMTPGVICASLQAHIDQVASLITVIEYPCP